MTQQLPLNNKKNTERECVICDVKTRSFIRAHIPRGENLKYYVCLPCERKINYFISPFDQEHLTIESTKRILLTKKFYKIRWF